jgi:hypothetical protein
MRAIRTRRLQWRCGFIDSQTDHQPNHIRVGRDGRIYFTVGAGGNAGVLGEDMLPFVTKNPETHTTTCNDIVLTGRNLHIPNYLTDDPVDYAITGAFLPFGIATHPGQTIEERTKCGGAIHVFRYRGRRGDAKTLYLEISECDRRRLGRRRRNVHHPERLRSASAAADLSYVNTGSR